MPCPILETEQKQKWQKDFETQTSGTFLAHKWGKTKWRKFCMQAGESAHDRMRALIALIRTNN